MSAGAELQEKVAIILASGSDVNLWPLSNEVKPKQFSYFLGEGTLLQNTYERLLSLYEDREIYLVTSSGYEDYVFEQLPDIKKENVIIEPFVNGSLSALMLVNVVVSARKSENCVLNIYPADHIINDVTRFAELTEETINYVSSNNVIVALGAKPNKALDKLGYIQILENNAEGDSSFMPIHTFAEKPDIKAAKRFLKSGDFYWNTGIYSIKSGDLTKMFSSLYPNEFAYLFNLATYVDNRNFDLQTNLLYRRLKPLSIENDLFEKHKLVNSINFMMQKIDFQWLDLDNWDEVYSESKKDTKANVIEGRVISLNSERNLIKSENLTVVAIGVNDLVIVEKEGKLLICDKNSLGLIKDAYIDIRKIGGDLTLS